MVIIYVVHFFSCSTRTVRRGSMWVSQGVRGTESRDNPADAQKIQIFTTTWNMGECINVADVGDLSRWIPANGGDYDILAVALQEAKISHDMLQAIHSHLGKPPPLPRGKRKSYKRKEAQGSIGLYAGLEEFTAFTSFIGESFFGRIELFVFVSTDLIKAGKVQALFDLVKGVKTGINLGVDRAPNKGGGCTYFVDDQNGP